MNKRIIRIIAAAFAMIFVSGCAVTGALESENGFKYISTQVSQEKPVGEIILHNMPESDYFKFPLPAIFSDYTEKAYGIVEGDIYVSVNGNDETGDGSKAKPFASIEKARDTIRAMKAEGKLPDGGITVSVMAGEYRLEKGIVFTEEDTGTAECPITYAAYGDGEVSFIGSTNLSASDFYPVGDDIKAILPDESKDKVVMIDLKKYGITADEIKLPEEMGRRAYQKMVDLFINRVGYDLARYPNYDESVRPKSFDWENGIYTAPAVMVNRMKTWHSFEDIVAVGLFEVDYHPDYAYVNVLNAETGEFNFKNYDNATRSDADYYFYNVLDELDIPGEWYLDRDECLLYVYPHVDLASAQIEFLHDFTDVIFKVDNCNYYTIKGFVFSGTRNSALVCDGVNNFTVDTCKFYDITGEIAVTIGGNNCTVINCEAHYLADEGIEVWGGEKNPGFVPSNNLIENCYVTNWSRGRVGSGYAFGNGGTGGVLRNSEAAYSTGRVLSNGQALNVAEYNLFHDCTTWSTDMGSMYVGSSAMGCANNTYRYNIFYNIGSERGQTAAMFWDDGHGSQRAYGNLYVNIAGNGQTIGGGRNHTFMNNIIVNVGRDPIYYDERPFEGYHVYGGAEDDKGFYSLGGGYMFDNYSKVPHTQPWFEAIAYLHDVITDTSDTFAAHFLYAPSMSNVTNNVIVDNSNKIGNIFKDTRHYSIFRDNFVGNFNDLEKIFVDPENGDYRIKEGSLIFDYMDDFKDIPYHLVGRY